MDKEKGKVMRIITEKPLYQFDAWAGGQRMLDEVIAAGKCDQLEEILDDLYVDGIDDTALNDYLWFEGDEIREMLGMIEWPDDDEDADAEEDE